MQAYPQSKLILVDAITVVIAWLALLTCLGLLALGFFSSWKPDEFWLKVSGAVFVVFAVLHVILALFHACPSCGKHPTVQGFSPPHENSTSIGGMDGWASVVWSVVTRRRFTCIHCGAKFIVAA